MLFRVGDNWRFILKELRRFLILATTYLTNHTQSVQNTPVGIVCSGVLEHLARSIGAYFRENLFGMFAFTGYFDASGGKDAEITSVAGWMATIGEWEHFETDWRILLAKYDLPYFHMKEFAHSTGPFKDWKGEDNKRQNFMRLAVDVIRSRVHWGVACGVEHDVFKKVNAEYRLAEAVGNEYSFAARDCMAQANKWVRKVQTGIQVNYVFDEGDRGAGRLVDIVQRHNLAIPNDDRRQLSIPIFKPSRDKGERKGLVPLQAADFAAYEYLKAYRIGEFAPLYRHRKSMLALAKIPSWSGIYTRDDLVKLCRRSGISKR